MKHYTSLLISLLFALVGAAVVVAPSIAQSLPATAAGKPDIARAEQLLREGKFDEAYRLLAPHEFAKAGDEEFDYLLGIAALESNRADQATLIFERVLAVNPNHAAARLDMGRAYFALGDMDRARIEFESARRFGPPAAAQATIDQYLTSIDKRTSSNRLKISSYLETVIGVDDNINNATSQGSIFTPFFGANINLTTNSIKLGDNFLSLGGGVDVNYAITGQFSLLTGADFRQRANQHANTFDYRNTDWRLGGQYNNDRDTIRLIAWRNDYDLDAAFYRRTQNVSAEWRRNLDTKTQLSLYTQDARSRYVQPASRSSSSNLYIYGANLVRVVDEDTRTIVFGSFFRGLDVATDNRSDGDRRLWGVRAGMQRALFSSLNWFASTALQKSSYSTENLLFNTTRVDHQIDLALGLSWQITPDWLLRPQVTFTRNDSNMTINTFDRTEASIILRRDFR